MRSGDGLFEVSPPGEPKRGDYDARPVQVPPTTRAPRQAADVIWSRCTATLNSMAFQRIVADHRVMAGVPCIRGTRIPVATLVGLVAEGMTTGEILADYPQLTADDVREALQFAAAAVDQTTFPLPASA